MYIGPYSLAIGFVVCQSIGGCADQATIEVDDLLSGIIECTAPRPDACTQQYQPVCARRDTGIRCVTTPCPSFELRTMSNACTACSNPDVYGYAAGACSAAK